MVLGSYRDCGVIRSLVAREMQSCCSFPRLECTFTLANALGIEAAEVRGGRESRQDRNVALAEMIDRAAPLPAEISQPLEASNLQEVR